MAGRVLAPLRRITATTQHISEENLHQRLALAGPNDEITALAGTIDGLLARLQGAFDAQRAFVANASHELRTPLAMKRTSLDVAAAKSPPISQDRDLPGIHGDTICRMITDNGDPAMVLMLTAADAPADRVSGLGLGADDYLPKPFHFPELVLRVRTLARRKPTAQPASSKQPTSSLTRSARPPPGPASPAS
jgi:CheY-like chemotaxis protein